MLLDCRSELGLAELPPKRDDLVAIPLERQEIVAVCPPGTVLPAPGRLPIAHLADHPLVATPAGTSMRDLVDRALATAAVRPRIAVETSQREAIAPLVLGGAGTSFLPRALAENLTSQGAVVARLVPTLVRTIGLLHRGSPLTPAARGFVELARRETKRPSREPSAPNQR
jgi:DNA-binding transcriptional LysR family regulator